MIHPSELILNDDGSIYHLKLHPDQIAKDIIVVGDPGRVKLISSYFNTIEHTVENREFITHTGTLNGKRLTVMATGIGTDNIDIVMNELDALVNVDLKKRVPKKIHTKLNILRIGTCGSIQKDVPADQFVLSSHAIGMDGLLNFYQFSMNKDEEELMKAFISQTNWKNLNRPYLVSGSAEMKEKFMQIEGIRTGITLTAPGFYAPQGRSIRLQPAMKDQNTAFANFSHNGMRVINYEMETSALYGLSSLLGHDACTICLVVANRSANSFSKNYKASMKELIENVLAKI